MTKEVNSSDFLWLGHEEMTSYPRLLLSSAFLVRFSLWKGWVLANSTIHLHLPFYDELVSKFIQNY
jgi:hypothetical protein